MNQSLTTMPHTAEPFTTGNVVQLASGGPLMTIYAITAEEIRCIYLDKTAKAQHANFPKDLLILTDNNPAPVLSFEVGKQVNLRSDLLIDMTIGSVVDHQVNCFWFTSENIQQNQLFDSKLLTPLHGIPTLN